MKKIILASSSPRRIELLKQIGINPQVIKSQIEETIREFEIPEQVAMSLAFRKAYDVALNENQGIFIGADTIVVFEDEILGKPKDKEDAFFMLKKLSNKEHYVITGFSILDLVNGIKIVDYEKTKVTFNELTEDRIKAYIETNEPLDKAAAYGIQGKGALLVKRLEGCYFNVVGLPLSKVEYYLRNYFNINTL